jgi:hypothetical protein
MSIRTLLEANCQNLVEEYHSRISFVLSLQEILIEDILPSIRDELQLDESRVLWSREWLEDTGQSRLCQGEERRLTD